MNLEILSNARNKVGSENYTNEFVMPLPTLLDAENKEMYMRILNISYPLTIEKVYKLYKMYRLTLNSRNISDLFM
jgi:hypothetical protein